MTLKPFGMALTGFNGAEASQIHGWIRSLGNLGVLENYHQTGQSEFLVDKSHSRFASSQATPSIFKGGSMVLSGGRHNQALGLFEARRPVEGRMENNTRTLRKGDRPGEVIMTGSIIGIGMSAYVADDSQIVARFDSLLGALQFISNDTDNKFYTLTKSAVEQLEYLVYEYARVDGHATKIPTGSVVLHTHGQHHAVPSIRDLESLGHAGLIFSNSAEWLEVSYSEAVARNLFITTLLQESIEPDGCHHRVKARRFQLSLGDVMDQSASWRFALNLASPLKVEELSPFSEEVVREHGLFMPNKMMRVGQEDDERHFWESVLST